MKSEGHCLVAFHIKKKKGIKRKETQGQSVNEFDLLAL